MSLTRRWWRSTIRVRLTVLYAGAFFLAGSMLVALMYFQLGQVLSQNLVVFRSARVDDVSESASPLAEEAPETPPRILGVVDALGERLGNARAETLRRMLITSIALLGVVGVIAGVLGWMLAGQALHPLRQITATARRIAGANLHERIALQGPDDEIKALADTLDSMLERLDRTFDTQQRFISNASHELRTPLAINRTLLEVALLEEPGTDERLRQLGTTLLAVNRRHEKLIEGLLTLTSSEQQIPDPVPVDLADIARHVVSESGSAARAADIEIRSGLRQAPTAGDPVLLERLIQNLVDNAIRYNLPDGGWIAIETRAANDRAALLVENTGPMVPPYEVPRLFEPFQRLSATERLAEQSNTGIGRGAGLGLSIVRSVALAHGGKVEAAARSEGGLSVTVLLPLERSDGAGTRSSPAP